MVKYKRKKTIKLILLAINIFLFMKILLSTNYVYGNLEHSEENKINKKNVINEENKNLFEITNEKTLKIYLNILDDMGIVRKEKNNRPEITPDVYKGTKCNNIVENDIQIIICGDNNVIRRLRIRGDLEKSGSNESFYTLYIRSINAENIKNIVDSYLRIIFSGFVPKDLSQIEAKVAEKETGLWSVFIYKNKNNFKIDYLSIYMAIDKKYGLIYMNNQYETSDNCVVTIPKVKIKRAKRLSQYYAIKWFAYLYLRGNYIIKRAEIKYIHYVPLKMKEENYKIDENSVCKLAWVIEYNIANSSNTDIYGEHLYIYVDAVNGKYLGGDFTM